jgi:hypothetical protein
MRTSLEDAAINLEGNEDTTVAAASLLTTLDAWMEANTVLTMHSVFTPFDNRSVYLEPIVTDPISIVFDESAEKISATLILVEP